MFTMKQMVDWGDLERIQTHPDWTVFDYLEQHMGIKLLTVKVQCKECGHTWGISLDEYESYAEVPWRKFLCIDCRLRIEQEKMDVEMKNLERGKEDELRSDAKSAGYSVTRS